MQYLRYSTDSQEVPFGIFVDSTDGNTEETGLTIANTDIKIWKAGATTLANKNSGGATHISNGIYYAVFDSTDTNTLGSGKAFIHVSGALYQVLDFCVLPQKVYDSMIAGSDNLEVDTIQVGGTSQTANDMSGDINTLLDRIIGTIASGTHNPQSGDAYSRIGAAGAGLTALGDTRLSALTDWLDGERLDLLLDALLTRLSETRAGYLDNLSAAPPTAAQIRSEIDSNSTQLAAIIANIAALNNISTSQVLTQVQSALNSYDAPTKEELDSAVSPLATLSALNTVAGYVDTEVSAILAVINKLDAMLELDGSLYRFTVNALENAPSGGAGGGDATAANQATIISHLTDIKGSTFSGSTDSLEAIRDRGDSAWITGGGASGSNAITLTVTDTDDVNIVDAAVEIWDSAGTSFIERKASNSSGQAVFNLDSGTYTVKIHKAGYSIANQTLVVSAAASVTYEMTAYVVSAPASAELCRVYGYFFNLDGDPYTALTAALQVNSAYSDSNNFFSDKKPTSYTGVYDAATGLLYFDVVRGATVVLKIPVFNITETITIPDAATAQIEALIEATV